VLAGTRKITALRGEFQQTGSQPEPKCTLRTVYGLSTGPALIGCRRLVRVSLTSNELHQLALAVRRDAEMAEREGNHAVAERLHWRVADLREAAR